MAARKKRRVVWLVVNETKGLAYGGEWKSRRKDAEVFRREAEWNARGDGYTYRVVRAEVQP